MLSEAFDGMGSSGIDCSSGGSSHEVSTLALAQMRMENWICGGKRDDRGSNIHGPESTKFIRPGFKGSNRHGYIVDGPRYITTNRHDFNI